MRGVFSGGGFGLRGVGDFLSGGGEGDLLVDDAGIMLMGFGVGVRLSLSFVSLIWWAFIRAILAALTRRSKSVMMIFLVFSMCEYGSSRIAISSVPRTGRWFLR